MKLLRLLLFVFLPLNIADFTRAQYNLYGSPDPVRMPQQQYQPVPQQASVPYPNYQAPYGAQTTTGVYTQQTAPYNTYKASSGYVAPQTQPYSAPAGYNPQQGQVRPTANYSSNNPAYRVASVPRPAYMAQQPTQAMSQPPAPAMPEPIPALNEPAMQQNPGPSNQMLNEQGPVGPAANDGYVPYNAPNSSCGPNRSCVNQFQDAACGVDFGCGYAASPWYLSLTGLAMTRTSGNRVWTTNEPQNPPNSFEWNQLMNTQTPQPNWKFGGEIRFGRRFCTCGCDPCGSSSGAYWAVEADYWTIDAFDSYASMRNPNRVSNDPTNMDNTVNTPLTMRYISFIDVNNINDRATSWFDGAMEHRIWRRDEVHSAEINLIRGQWANVCGSNWDFAFSIGPRFFRFNEDLRFGAVRNGYEFGQNPIAEAYLNDQITNSLWGGQIGCDIGYNFCGGALRLFVTPKVGAYDNYITNYFSAELGNGAEAMVNYGPGTFPVSSTTNTFAILSQIDVGAEWFFAHNWSARFGYRVVAISGIGLADNQIPPYVNDTEAIRNINTNGDLILHGAFGTVTFNF